MLKGFYRLLGVNKRNVIPSYVHKTRIRSFDVAKFLRSAAGWITSSVHIDQDLRSDLRTIRARARDLCINNPYCQNYVRLMRRNVFGANGFSLQVKARDTNGLLDKFANRQIEDAFWYWGRKGNCTVDRKLSWKGAQDLCASSIISDGEIIIRKRYGFNNKNGFAIQFIDPEMLDVNLNQSRDDKNNEIRLGVELDADDAPIAYHFCEPKSFAYNGSYPQGGNHVVVPAKDIIHIFPKDRIGQTRGWPLIVPIMEALKNLNEYEKSEMTAARIGANQVGFLETPTGAEYDGSTNDDGTKSMDLEAGEIRELPAGHKFTSWDPKHPTDAFSEFVRSMKLSMAAGVSVSYPTFTGDLTGVNFSSIRAGLLEDREEWKSWQTLFIEGFAEPVFSSWLEASLTNQSIALPLSKFDKFNSPEFIGRRWAWVDPLKDANANKILIEERLTTRTRLAKELGLDYEELLEEIQTEQETEKEMGISSTSSENTNTTEYNPKDEEDDEEEGKV